MTRVRRHRFHPRGVWARGAVRRAPDAEQWGASIDRALLSLGRAIEQPDAARRPARTLGARGASRAQRRRLDRDGAEAGVSESIRQNPGLVLAGADFDVHQFDAMGARFTDLKLRMREARRDGHSTSMDPKSPALRIGPRRVLALRTDGSSRGSPESRCPVAAALPPGGTTRRAAATCNRRRRQRTRGLKSILRRTQ